MAASRSGPFLRLAFLLICIASPGSAAEPQWSITGETVPALTNVDAAMRSFMMQRDIRQGAVAITRKGRLVYARGYTYAVPGYPITQPETLFRIASVSKPITSILIHQLIEQGVISYDTKVVDYLGLEAPPGRSMDPRLRDATIDHLLRHTGGWDRDRAFDPMFYDAPISSSLGVSRPISKYDIASYMTGQTLQAAPGQRYAYSNYGYSLLGMVVEKATGLDYTEAVRQLVFAPIGVTRPRLGHSLRSEWLPDEAIYETGADGYNQENLDSHGGWILAAPDMVRLLTIFDDKDGNPLLSRESIDAMFIPNPGSSYARGWELSSDGNNLRAYSHSGRLAPGMRSVAAWFSGSPDIFDGVSIFAVITRNDVDPGEPLLAALQQVSSWPDHDLFESVGIESAPRRAPPVESWIQIAGHADGNAGSSWRSDLALLNRSTLPNTVRVRYYDVLKRDLDVELAPGEQRVISDVTQATGGRDFGPVRIFGSEVVTVSSRTYNESTTGTFGQYLGEVIPRTGLRTGDRGILPALRENTRFRTNIGIHNPGRRMAAVRVTLYDSTGHALAAVDEQVRANATLQLNAPFLAQASRSDIDSGYAEIEVLRGDDVTAYASVVDRGTNDPTTIPLERGSGSERQWIAAAAHLSGANDSEWRTDLAILSLSNAAVVGITLRADDRRAFTHTIELAPKEQVILDDIVASLLDEGAGSLEIVSDTPVIAVSRTYNASGEGSFGQFIDGASSGASQGDTLWLPQLRHDVAFRTNLAFLNTGSSEAEISVAMHDAAGDRLGVTRYTIDAGSRLQIGSAFASIAEVTSIENGYATVEIVSGSGLQAFASVVDNRTNDPTTIPAAW